MVRWRWCVSILVGSLLVASCSLVNKPADPEEPEDDSQGGTAGVGGSTMCDGPLNTLDNCGECGTPCSPENVSGATCADGTCDYATCNGSFQDCDQDRTNGCESNKLTDPVHCGACAINCNVSVGFENVDETICVGGSCDWTTCALPYADCDNDHGNGCEFMANTLTACGGCNTVCAPDNVVTANCNGGVCGYDSCATGFDDCDNDTSNGCESNVSNDPSNCGMCGNPCAAMEGCSNGMCTQALPSCRDLLNNGFANGNGLYTIDPNGGTPADAITAYCDMTTDGGGWTLITWTGNSASAPNGVPYPGLAPCPAHNCLRGSVAASPIPELLFKMSSEIGQGQSQTTMASFAALSGYTYAGKHTYPSLANLTLTYGSVNCSTVGPLAQGVFTALVGPTTYNNTVVYLSQALSYASYDFSSDANSYIWNIGVPSAYCSGSGTPPGSWMGTWSSNQYGPYLSNTAGAYSVWVR